MFWEFVSRRLPYISRPCLIPVPLSLIDGTLPTLVWLGLLSLFLKGKFWSSSATFVIFYNWFWSLWTCCFKSSTLFATLFAILRLCCTFFIEAPTFTYLRASFVSAWCVSSSFLISSLFKLIFAILRWLSANFSSSSLSAGYWSFSTLSIGFLLSFFPSSLAAFTSSYVIS